MKKHIILIFALFSILTLQSITSAQDFDCSDCHDNLIEGSVHDGALECSDCHSDVEDEDHADVGVAKVDCADCHDDMAEMVSTDIHHQLNVSKRKAPNCKTCHGTHKIRAVESVNNKEKYYCSKCHGGEVILANPFHSTAVKNAECFECHDETEYKPKLEVSVHKNLKCSNCHNYISHNLVNHPDNVKFTQVADCYLCHNKIAAEHRESIHGISILAGVEEAANCWDCHGSHKISHVKAPESSVAPMNLSETCGGCHNDVDLIEKFEIPASCPSKQYTESVHGKLVAKGEFAANCSSCHGVHNIKAPGQHGSMISPYNSPETCGKCHPEIAEKYKNSIHWIRVKKGRRFAPVCIDCHCEHGIDAPVSTKYSRKKIKQLQQKTCVECHKSVLVFSEKGAEELQAVNYEDSYHGLATSAGDESSAMCVDCHGVHSILPANHPGSKIAKDRILQTCKKCHENATPKFAESYSHTKTVGNSQTIQDWVQTIYVWLIIVVIGGMILHNLLIYVRELREKKRHESTLIPIPRFTKNEVYQHLLLLISFILLAITGFALKYTESWYAEILRFFGLSETLRGNIHRVSAVAMVALSFYHLFYLLLTPRGREVLLNLVPNLDDFRGVSGNLLYYLRLSKNKPEFGWYDYAEKAEYWALIWGTVVMGATGFFLWFPTLVSDWAPVWFIKVCEIIHFYEAVLATLAIIVWHWFFVIFRPSAYPVNFAFVDGKMPLKHYKEHHGKHFREVVLEWKKWKEGKINEKEVSNFTKIFDSTLRNNNFDPE